MSDEPGGEWGELERSLGYRFTDRSLIAAALTHRSHSYEQGAGYNRSYERLEFLGDALLGFFVSAWLYRDDPEAAEGSLSRRRQEIVRSETLAGIAQRLGLGQAIRLGRGEELTGGRSKPSLLADVFEAVLGAIYLDGGVDQARAFVDRTLGALLVESRGTSEAVGDFKTRLQERVQRELQQTPRYRIVSTKGPAHDLEFVVEVYVQDRVVGRGQGSTRKKAEQEAARQALPGFGETGD